ncbi:acyl carrier protein [Alicyclobacillus hesperidum URH17-3-68]|uniref:Acyl carrier protein n=1 Tax=Alicyclobacillus hesperidum TaxID=89784 RepID=A0A1H2QZK5_9BACL|nr:acyl carrier protein [Alicyclobacillus hesperidum]KRW93002.1 acyl carrier protein [Alicyclobacillus tengchongensis]EJY55467.1 acyl carrier protein [Alicyclobacillus hesperidum URH17-3-68]SDW12064.1 acyl carrier protein [Alicyclobacillus hesperidum]GLG00410.1 acyl carrier protein [Alicyclobacillus hesperidum subsp. aegles]GLV13255.1 acyl carrier protein [Alicyclobacillus hesperidum]
MAEALNKQQIEERVRKVVVNQLQVDAAEVKPDSLFVDDLGADSLDLTELAVAFEDEFDIEIPEADFGQLSTVEGVVQYISGRLAH